jgi:serine/threonine protein kinase
LNEVEQLTRLKHHCITPLFVFVLPAGSKPLKIGRPYYDCGSLEEVLSDNPVWWTRTAKAKAIAGIALGMETAHRFGIVHGSLKPNNILFDENHCVHIVDFGLSCFESSGRQKGETDDRTGLQELLDAMKADAFSFTSMLFDILIDRPVSVHSLEMDDEEKLRIDKGEHRMIPEYVRRFARDLIENRWCESEWERRPFEEIVDLMKQNHFDFSEEVDICEVQEFVKTVEDLRF